MNPSRPQEQPHVSEVLVLHLWNRFGAEVSTVDASHDKNMQKVGKRQLLEWLTHQCALQNNSTLEVSYVLRQRPQGPNPSGGTASPAPP